MKDSQLRVQDLAAFRQALAGPPEKEGREVGHPWGQGFGLGVFQIFSDCSSRLYNAKQCCMCCLFGQCIFKKLEFLDSKPHFDSPRVHGQSLGGVLRVHGQTLGISWDPVPASVSGVDHQQSTVAAQTHLQPPPAGNTPSPLARCWTSSEEPCAGCSSCTD